MPQLSQSTRDGLKILGLIILTFCLIVGGGILFFYWLIDKDTLTLILWMD